MTNRLMGYNLYDTLLTEYTKEEVQEHLRRINTTFTKRNKTKDNLSVIVPNLLKNYEDYCDFAHTSEYKFIPLDIKKYAELKEVHEQIQKEFSAVAAKIQNSYISDADIENKYIDAIKNIVVMNVEAKDILDTVINIYETTKDIALCGIILEANGVRHNMTHPSTVYMLLHTPEVWHAYVETLCDTEVTLYIFAHEDKNYYNSINTALGTLTDEDKATYRKYMESLILYQLALIDTFHLQEQEVNIQKDMSKSSDFSDSIVFFSDPYYTFTRDNVHTSYGCFTSNIYYPSDKTLPDSANDITIDIPFYVPVDIVDNSKTAPYYGGAIITASYGVEIGTVKRPLLGKNIGLFRSNNIDIHDDKPNAFSYVCTGKVEEFSMKGLSSLNYSNALSAYHHATIPALAGEWVELNIKTAVDIVKEFNENNRDKK